MSFLVVIAFIGLFVLIIRFAIKSAKAQAQRRDEVMQQLGFRSVTLPDGQLETRIDRAFRWRKTPTTIHKPYLRDQMFGKFYLAELRNGSDSDSQDLTICAILPNLNLPRFFVYPTIPGDGTLARLAQKALTWVIERTGTRQVSPDLIPCTGYQIYADNESAVRSALDRSFWDQFARIPGHLAIQAEGDFVIISTMWGGSARARVGQNLTDYERFKALIDTAEQVCRLIGQHSERTSMVRR